ncbi:MAG: nicotinamidase [Candidatus Binatus sp.]|uniref:nicotinamidase n=1 Tax=Candidatus Binatus sp. TaxID=2811406 RepID=UPI002716551B|nr:nicotinamidase [Candidatus Binatus sp.]MDO8432602.1 nicotinamidase [Candidatus Binatus sp.]
MKEKIIPLGNDRSALLVVDMQPDFMPGGALAVQGGDEIVAPLGALMESGLFDVIVATQDWHPRDHVSFASNHPGRMPFETIELYGYPQTLWPDHCVQGTPGAELHSGLPWHRASAIIRKATDASTDSYSALRNNWNPHGERPPTGLGGYLINRGVEHVFACGLARDYCVAWSAEDARDAGFSVSVIWDLCRSIDPSRDDALRDDLDARGIAIVTAAQVAQLLASACE